jgi:hypothetical protein
MTNVDSINGARGPLTQAEMTDLFRMLGASADRARNIRTADGQVGYLLAAVDREYGGFIKIRRGFAGDWDVAFSPGKVRGIVKHPDLVRAIAVAVAARHAGRCAPETHNGGDGR